jgi:aminopeptidase N
LDEPCLSAANRLQFPKLNPCFFADDKWFKKLNLLEMIRTILILILSASLLLPACRRTRSFYEPGVSLELAQYRSKHISEVHYDLWFNIPANQTEPVAGKAIIHFRQLKSLHGVNLDFQPGAEFIHEVLVNGQVSDYNFMNQHIIIPSDHIIPGKNKVEIAFTSSDQALNRSGDFMYTLFVPDRASTAFPCFDQPDLKATYNLSLEIPESWTALSNGPLIEEQTGEGRKTMQFSMQKPISTYLFAFAAGEFQSIEKSHNGKSITMLHRETDQKKLDLNADRIFRQHFESLAWLEDYTGIPYPYEKFDIAIIPGFQYSGMEHPGAIWYRDERLLLDESAPLMQQLRKASLIAHETAHMWFGNLVTMKWFDDVWLKEVFAGFMADKMIAPQFPEINHELQFTLTHYPRAYSIDRSGGTHPIRQELANMNMAGTLYGPIIYNKAPIIFRQLEDIMQADNFRTAVQEYLQKFSHANADWDDLATIFDRHSENNISLWSKAWVYGKGMPVIDYEVEIVQQTQVKSLHIKQMNQPPMNPFPAQLLSVGMIYLAGTMVQDLWLELPELLIPTPDGKRSPLLVILNGGGMGYGYFAPSEQDKAYIARSMGKIPDENLRAAIFVNLYEDFLNDGQSRQQYAGLLLSALQHETNPQLINYLCGNLKTLSRNFLDPVKHAAIIADAEKLLWQKLYDATPESKQVFLDTWLALARSPESLQNMLGLYNKRIEIPDFSLSEANQTLIACEIALRSKNGKEILENELQRIENHDRKRRLAFIKPALSDEQAERDIFFERLKKPENRNPEPWVLEALNYLHHPLREGASQKYVAGSLEMLGEIQITGDIFFPKNWLDATLGNYQNAEVAHIVNQYLESHPGLPENLRLKVLQSADLLFRNNSF